MRPSIRRGLAAGFLLVALAVPAPAFAAEPSAVPQSVETPPSTPLQIVLSGTDGDADALTFAISTDPTNGALGTIDTPACEAGTCTANVEYTPTGAFRGTDSFEFTVDDGGATSAPATVSIVVDTAPVAVADPDGGCSAHPNGTYETNEDILLSVSGLPCRLLANDTDAETDALTAVLGTPGTGTPVVDANGSFTYMPATNVNSTGAASEVTDSFTYVADDGLLASAPATVSIHVWPVNDPPTFTSGSLTIEGTEDTAYDEAWASAMSPGPADESAQIVTFTVVADDPTLFEVGPAVDAATGNLSFTPAANANGTTNLTITLGDTGGTDRGGDPSSNAVTVSVTISPENDAPIAVDDTVSVPEDATSVPIDVLDDDTDVDLDTLTVISATDPANGTATANGTDVTYIPDPGYLGTDTFDYTISDGLLEDTATVSITVTPVNDAPSFTMGSATSVNEDSGAASIESWVTAMSPGPIDEAAQVLTLAVTGNTAPGIFAVQPALSPTGTLTFTPKANAKGNATITVTLSDDGGTADLGVDSTSATFVLTIASKNDAPTFTLAGDQTVLEDPGPATVAFFVTAMSPGPLESGQSLTLTVPTFTNPGLFLVGPTIDQGTGQLTFTPAANAFGSSTVTVRLKDSGGTANEGVDTTEKTFKITVTAVNDAPSVAPGVNPSVVEDAGAQTLTDWATFSPGPANESGQTVSAYTITSNSNAALFAVLPAVSASGTLTFTPAADAHGSATLGLRVTDSGGTGNGGVRVSAIVTFTITVLSANDAPTAIPGANPTVAEDAGAQTVAAWATFDSGPPNEASETAIAYAIVSNSNPSLFGVAPAVAPNGTLTFTPGANRNGVATLGLRVTDSGGTANGGITTSATADFTITVTAVNDAPNAVNDTSFSVVESGPAVALDVLANDTTIDGAEALTVTLVSDPAHGTAVVNGTGTGVTYKPDPGYVGTDVFTYTISDPGLLTDTATVLVTVVADETAPTATKPVQGIRSATTAGQTTVPARISWTATDGGSGVASVQLQRSIDGGAYATVALSGPLAVRFDTALATGHTYRFRVRATDAAGNVGAWAYGTAFLVARDEDTSPAITYAGTWSAAALVNASGGSTRFSTTAGATATWAGTARDVAIVAPRSSGRGSFRVYVDDVLVATVVLTNATTQDRRIVWQRHFSTLAAHTVRIEVVGDGRVDLDAIAVLR